MTSCCELISNVVILPLEFLYMQLNSKFKIISLLGFDRPLVNFSATVCLG